MSNYKEHIATRGVMLPPSRYVYHVNGSRIGNTYQVRAISTEASLIRGTTAALVCTFN